MSEYDALAYIFKGSKSLQSFLDYDENFETQG